MKNRFKDMAKLLSIPLVLMAVYLSTYIVWHLFNLPSDEQMLVIVKQWFAAYGLWIVFGAALIEGFLLLGQYFPGSFIIFLGVISAGKDVFRVIQVVFVISAAFFISYTLNYIVGKYGWYKLLSKFGLTKQIENSKAKLTKQGLNVIFFTYWEPNLASLTATAAGILSISLKKFSTYSLAGIIVWNVFWGTLVYMLGESALEVAGLKWVIIIFCVWVGIILSKKYVGKNKIA